MVWRMGLMCLSKPSTMERSSGGGEQILHFIGTTFWVGSKLRKISCFFPGMIEEIHRNVCAWQLLKPYEIL